MKFAYCRESVTETNADVVALAVPASPFKDATLKSLDAASDGAFKRMAKDHDFTGKLGQTLLVPAQDVVSAKYLVLVGIGTQKKLDVAVAKDTSALAVKQAMRVRAQSLAIFMPRGPDKTSENLVENAVIGATLAAYRFATYKTKNEPAPLKTVLISAERTEEGKKGSLPPDVRRKLRPAITRAQSIAQSVCLARDFVNQPPAAMTPAKLAAEARKIAKKNGLTVKVLGRKECERLGMGMLLAVGQGSVEEPKLIHLTYKPKTKAKRKIALIGKGITFDSGGYSIKPSAGMLDMKIDMAGAATVIAAMNSLAAVGCKHEVHAIAPCAENLVSGDAYKLGDVLKAMDGTTVEINNTDAEGRLALGDAIAYARKVVGPDEMFDFATLTGACMIALGPYTAAVMSDHDALANKFLDAGERAGEDFWRLPLTPALKVQLKSSIADMRNTGERFGGALTAGLFLKHFVKDTAWVHVDIAGPAASGRTTASIARGGTGFAVASILEYLSA